MAAGSDPLAQAMAVLRAHGWPPPSCDAFVDRALVAIRRQHEQEIAQRTKAAVDAEVARCEEFVQQLQQEMQQQAATADARVSEAVAKASQWQARAEAIERSAPTWSTRTAAQREETMQQIVRKTETLGAAIVQKDAQIARLQAAVTERDAELTRIQEAVAGVKQLQGQLQAVRSERDMAIANEKRSVEQCGRLLKEKDAEKEAVCAAKENELLQEVNADYIRRDESEQSLLQLRQQLETAHAAQLRTQTESLAQRASEIERLKMEQQSLIQRVSEQTGRLETYMTQSKTLAKQNSELTAERQRLVSNLASCDAARATCTQNLMSLQDSTNRRVQEVNNELESQKERYESTVAQLRANLADVTTKFERAKARADAFERQIENYYKIAEDAVGWVRWLEANIVKPNQAFYDTYRKFIETDASFRDAVLGLPEPGLPRWATTTAQQRTNIDRVINTQIQPVSSFVRSGGGAYAPQKNRLRAILRPTKVAWPSLWM